MSLSDPVANLLTVIRNAVHAQKETVEVPASRLGQKIVEIFKNDGYVEDVRFLKDNKQGILKVYFRPSKGKQKIITGLKRISRPGLRVYAKHDRVPRVLNGLGTAVLSTSKGVMSDRQARKQKVGGEVLCYIW